MSTPTLTVTDEVAAQFGRKILETASELVMPMVVVPLKQHLEDQIPIVMAYFPFEKAAAVSCLLGKLVVENELGLEAESILEKFVSMPACNLVSHEHLTGFRVGDELILILNLLSSYRPPTNAVEE